MDDARTAPEFGPDVIRFLAAIPARREDQESLGIASYRPLEGSQKTRCMGCEMPVWLGPKQFAELEQHPDKCQILCPVCIAAYLRPSGQEIVPLGRKGGEFVMKDGNVFLNDQPEGEVES